MVPVDFGETVNVCSFHFFGDPPGVVLSFFFPDFFSAVKFFGLVQPVNPSSLSRGQHGMITSKYNTKWPQPNTHAMLYCMRNITTIIKKH